MNQRTFIGARPTLLDIAKGAVESFVKVNMISVLLNLPSNSPFLFIIKSIYYKEIVPVIPVISYIHRNNKLCHKIGCKYV